MVDGKLLQRIVVWPTYEDAAAAEADAASEDCKRSNRLTVWQTEEQAAAHTNIGAGGGGGDYVASAVHFDGANTALSIASLSAPVSRKVTYAYWFKQDTQQIAKDTWGTDVGHIEPNGPISFNDIRSDGVFNSLIADGADTGEILIRSAVLLPTTWILILSSNDCDTLETDTYWSNSRMAMEEGFPNIFGVPFTPEFNGKSFYLGDDGLGAGPTMDLADFRIWTDVSLLVDGLIPEANLRLFIDADGKPVDPAVATAALGDPCILFSGNASTFGTNQGAGGAFTLTGTLTSAATSPSD